MKARVAGQYSAWHDPHNNGTYTVQNYGGTFSTSRLTGDKKYTDKQIFSLTSTAGGCMIEACSRSQVTSILDMGTNYCDLKMLLCGSSDGCKPLLHDFTLASEQTAKFSQASVDMGACLKVRSVARELSATEDSRATYLDGMADRGLELPAVALSQALPTSQADGPCCKECAAPLTKYFSVDARHGFCGETCMKPSEFWAFKIFEWNLTRAADVTPCREQLTPSGGLYSRYSSTVTHGVPGLQITLDLYAPVPE